MMTHEGIQRHHNRESYLSETLFGIAFTAVV